MERYTIWSSQGSILGPLLLNIFINYIFYFIKRTNITNYADDNTIYTKNTASLLKTLEGETSIILNWFQINEMKSNDDKCKLIVANHDYVSLILGNESIEASSTVELLCIKLDKNFNLNEHVSDLIKRANQKLHALARMCMT